MTHGRAPKSGRADDATITIQVEDGTVYRVSSRVLEGARCQGFPILSLTLAGSTNALAQPPPAGFPGAPPPRPARRYRGFTGPLVIEAAPGWKTTLRWE